MLIAIIGLPKSGKSTLVNHLIQQQDFVQVSIISPNDNRAPQSSTTTGISNASQITFNTSSDFLDYATKNWRRDFVTVDLKSRNKLVEFLKRPFVAVVAVEAPLGIRYKREVLR